MKTLLLFFLLSGQAQAQWRAVHVSSSVDIGNINENFRRSSYWAGRKADLFAQQTFFKQNTFKQQVTISSDAVISGNVGIGTTSPVSNLEITANSGNLTQNVLTVRGGGSSGAYGFLVEANNGDDMLKVDSSTYDTIISAYTQLGDTSTRIKIKKITGTTASSEGGQSDVAHGVTLSKIISATCLVTYGANAVVSMAMMRDAGYQFAFYLGASSLSLSNHTTNSENILSKPFVCTIIYEK